MAASHSKFSKALWDSILASITNYPENLLAKLPKDNWQFQQSLQQNEMFLLGIDPQEALSFINDQQLDKLNNYLYRVQKISATNYMFRRHIETQVADDEAARSFKKFIHVRSIGAYEKLNPIKVNISPLGEISII